MPDAGEEVLAFPDTQARQLAGRSAGSHVAGAGGSVSEAMHAVSRRRI